MVFGHAILCGLRGCHNTGSRDPFRVGKIMQIRVPLPVFKKRTRDPVTEKEDTDVQVIITSGKVATVNY